MDSRVSELRPLAASTSARRRSTSLLVSKPSKSICEAVSENWFEITGKEASAPGMSMPMSRSFSTRLRRV